MQSVVEFLGLKRRSATRYDCTLSLNGERAISINPEWQNKDGTLGRFTCFCCGVSGDLIALSAHINGTDDLTAAKEIEEKLTGYTPAKRGLQPDGFQDLTYDHERIAALGLTAERAKQLGIGYRNKGTTKDSVCIPIRDSKGKLLGYAMYSPNGLKFYKDIL